jgi:hypothetical protein
MTLRLYDYDKNDFSTYHYPFNSTFDCLALGWFDQHKRHIKNGCWHQLAVQVLPHKTVQKLITLAVEWAGASDFGAPVQLAWRCLPFKLLLATI